MWIKCYLAGNIEFIPSVPNIQSLVKKYVGTEKTVADKKESDAYRWKDREAGHWKIPRWMHKCAKYTKGVSSRPACVAYARFRRRIAGALYEKATADFIHPRPTLHLIQYNVREHDSFAFLYNFYLIKVIRQLNWYNYD